MFDILGIFGSKKIEEMDRSVAQSFSKVKQDTETLYQWVTYLYQQNQQLVEQNTVLKRLSDEQKFALNELRVTIQHLPKTSHEIKALVDQFYNFEPILQRIKHIEQKLELLEMRRERPVQPISSVSTFEQPERPASNLKEKLMRTLTRNSKDYIKNLVLGLVHKYSKVGALQLREMIVEEQGLCSKSTFYRILEEMEQESSLQVVSDGKHTVYIASAQQAAQ